MSDHHERREYNSQMFDTLTKISGDIGEMKGALASLSGPSGRVTMLEKAAETADTRFWIQSAILIPLFGMIHAGMKKLGL